MLTLATQLGPVLKASIDYMKMAQAIAAAMSNVNLVVKMERDIYAPSTLNPIGKRI
jgi:hypothetical protein